MRRICKSTVDSTAAAATVAMCMCAPNSYISVLGFPYYFLQFTYLSNNLLCKRVWCLKGINSIIEHFIISTEWICHFSWVRLFPVATINWSHHIAKNLVQRKPLDIEYWLSETLPALLYSVPTCYPFKQWCVMSTLTISHKNTHHHYKFFLSACNILYFFEARWKPYYSVTASMSSKIMITIVTGPES